MSDSHASTVWWLGGGVLGMGILAIASSKETREVVQATVSDGMALLKRIVDRTSKHEGTYDSLNLNTDGAGLSFGKLQWSQRTGALGQLLHACYLAAPGRFQAIFGPAWQALLSGTRAGGLAPVDGALLWHEPWVSRFRQAGREAVFCAIQDQLAIGGQYMEGAIQAAQTLGVTTERALSITYDTSVQQGPEAARRAARAIQERFRGRTVSARMLLEQYIAQAASPFVASQPPAQRPDAKLTWRKVGTEWHAFAGSIDLYLNITRRRTGLLNDRILSDIPITL